MHVFFFWGYMRVFVFVMVVEVVVVEEIRRNVVVVCWPGFKQTKFA